MSSSSHLQHVSTQTAPGNIAAYSQAVVSGNLVFASGSIGLDTSLNMTSDSIEGQTKQTLSNLTNVLAAAGASLSDVVKVTIFLVNMKDYTVVNQLYAAHFPSPLPARSCFAVVGLPRDALIEIEAIAVLKGK